MKKKRKKKATSPFCLRTFQFPLFTKATFAVGSRLGSAPDVPKSDGMKECLQFSARVFGKDGWPVGVCPEDIHLKIFSKQLTDKFIVHYNTVHVGDSLYVQIPLEGSRDSFVALLDYAEEKLEVARVVVCLDRNSQNVRDMVKTFRFMGFEHVQPTNPSATVKASQSGIAGASVSQGFYYLACDMD